MSEQISLEKNENESEGRYLYCVTGISEWGFFKSFGIEGSDVYSISYKDISALVSHCSLEPYQSNDSEIVKAWLVQHEHVIDHFFEKCDAVLPSAFDIIIKGNDQAVKSWLEQDYVTLKRKMDKIRGKQEFGIQIFYDTKSLTEEVMTASADIQKMLTEIQSKPRGLAYMQTQKMKELVKSKLEEKVKTYSNSFYDEIRSCVDDVKVDALKSGESDRRMLINLSCLTPQERVPALSKVLGRISEVRNISVKFTGPWPAYSFLT